MRGAQTDFTDSRGRPVILASSQIEHGFQMTSSCITCHSRASVGLRSSQPNWPGWQTYSLPPNMIPYQPVGAPDPKWFLDDRGETRYVQTHFVWSAPFRALSTKVEPPRE